MGTASGVVRPEARRGIREPGCVERGLGGPRRDGPAACGALGLPGRRIPRLVPARRRRLPLRCGIQDPAACVAIHHGQGPAGIPRHRVPARGPRRAVGGDRGLPRRGRHAMGLQRTVPEPWSPGDQRIPRSSSGRQRPLRDPHPLQRDPRQFAPGCQRRRARAARHPRRTSVVAIPQSARGPDLGAGGVRLHGGRRVVRHRADQCP